MNEDVMSFTYTAQRTSYLTIVGSLCFIMFIESGLIALLVLVLVHNLFISLAINLLHLTACLIVLALMLASMWTKHRLTKTSLHLTYGLSFNVQLPYSIIKDMQPVLDRQSIQPVSARYDARKQRIIACFSSQGQLVLSFAQPQQIKLGRKTHTVTSILFNVDQRDAFIDAFARQQLQIPFEDIADTQIVQGDSTERPNVEVVTLVAGMASTIKHNDIEKVETIHIEGVTRTFATVTAVDNVHLTISSGEIYGLLGSNGAGKTTLIKMLVGILLPSSGRVLIAGHDMGIEPMLAKAALGYVPDRALLYERLTGREFLEFLAQIHGLPRTVAMERIAYLLDLLELTEATRRLCGSYSLGMKRKLSLAAALLHQPRILILDEPLNGLDPRSTRRLKDLFLELAAKGTTILLSTHDLATAETICHRVGVFHRGHLVAEGSTSQLRQLVQAQDLETVFLHLTAEHVLSPDEVSV